MNDTDLTTVTELSDTELHMVAAGSGSLVNITVPIEIGVVFENQAQIAVLTKNVTQTAMETVNLSQFIKT
jgi:hypothetical protein